MKTATAGCTAVRTLDFRVRAQEALDAVEVRCSHRRALLREQGLRVRFSGLFLRTALERLSVDPQWVCGADVYRRWARSRIQSEGIEFNLVRLALVPAIERRRGQVRDPGREGGRPEVEELVGTAPKWQRRADDFFGHNKAQARTDARILREKLEGPIRTLVLRTTEELQLASW